MAALLDIPADLSAVHELLTASLVRVEQRFTDALRSDLPVVEGLCRHVEQYRGKMLRPTLVILSGLASAPEPGEPEASLVTEAHITLGAVCEMIHMATLVHDDVLDEADTRRSGRTVNRLAGNEAAVILGDYLFSSAYRLCATLDSQAAALLIGATGMSLCSGELLQLHHRGDFDLDEATYFEIVQRKTASLIGAACKLGALESGPRLGEPCHQVADRFHEFGLRLGVAFQIQDDLLDLTGTQRLVGKPVRRDIEMGKLTLPIIHHLKAAVPGRRARTLDLLGRGGASPEGLLDALTETASIGHAHETAARLVQEAKAALAPLADGPAKRFLLLMADAVITREF